MNDAPLLDAEHLGRRYGVRVALEDFSLRLERGELLGLLGVNGAGKTSALKLLAGVLAPSAGRVRIAGADLIEDHRAACRLVGYAPEVPPLYPDLTVSEYLAFCAALRGMHGAPARAACSAAIERLDLGDVRRRVIRALSRGFQQRVNLAQALLHSPPLLLLDEPTAGLDPLQAHRLLALVRELAREHGVVLSTHQLSEVREHCARVVVLHQGRIGFAGTVGQFTAARGVRVRLGEPIEFAQWNALSGVTQADSQDGCAWLLHSDAPEELLARLVPYCVQRGWSLLELALERQSLEQRFLALALGQEPAQAA